MAIRRSDREALEDLIDEYGSSTVLAELIHIFDEKVQTQQDEEALGVLVRAVRKVVKLQAFEPAPCGRGRALAANPAEDDDEAEEEGDEENEEEGEDEEEEFED